MATSFSEIHCFFCGQVCAVDKKHPNCSEGWHKIGILSFQASE